MRVEIDVYELLENIELEELLDEMGDKKLKKYLEKRSLKTDIFKNKEAQLSDFFSEIYDALRTNNLHEVWAVVDAYAKPKWSSPELCENEYVKLTGKTVSA